MTRPLPRDAQRCPLPLPIILFNFCFLLACGIQGPPQPPRVEQPEKVTDLTVTQVGRTLEITFSVPRLAADRERLTKPVEIELLRSRIAPGTTAANPPPFAPWVTLKPSQWSAYALENKITYPAQLSVQEYDQWLGETLDIAVRTLTRGFRGHPQASEISDPVQIPLLDVPVPVEDLKPQMTEKAVELAWIPPARSLRGQPVRDLAGYQVYRSTTGKPGSFNLLGETAVPHYADHEFQFGHTYYYTVRAISKPEGKAGESQDSLVAVVRPVDTFPPAAPTALTAVYSPGAVELVWTANTESDLAGYIVYRRQDEAPPERMNKELLPTPIYRDATVQPGRKYFYYLTAVDLAGNESKPSQEVAVETE